MDRPLTQKHWSWKRLAFWGLGLALTSTLVSLVINTNGSTYAIDRDRVRLGDVALAPFQEMIPVTGTIEPLRTLYLDAIEGGRVETVFVEEGALVEAGQPLVKLSNTTLSLDFMNRETQIIEQINNLRNTRMTMELNERDINTQLLDIDFELDKIARQFRIDTALYQAEVIATQQFENSAANFTYLQRKKRMLVTSNRKDSVNRRQQMLQIDNSIALMERNLKAIRQNLENLTVRAPISGQLTSFDAEIGETKNRGENLGRIDLQNGYRVRSRVDEHYINRVIPGQTGTFTLTGSSETHSVAVQKVLPEVTNGTFEVELQLSADAPQQLRTGQSLQVKLELSQPSDALLIPRGGFYNSTGGSWVFVVNRLGQAERRTVKLGRHNPTHIEVLEGLEPGEQVIVSSYSGFEEVDQVILNE